MRFESKEDRFKRFEEEDKLFNDLRAQEEELIELDRFEDDTMTYSKKTLNRISHELKKQKKREKKTA